MIHSGSFKPGQSGNPKGKPVGAYSLVGILKRKLQEAPPGQKKTWGELIVTQVMTQALKGKDYKAQKLVMNYIDGLPIARIADAEGNNIKLLLDLNFNKDAD